MRNSRRSREGELLIDHRNSPGIRPEDVAHMPGAIPVGAGKIFEAPFYRCNHRQATVVINPDRTRDHDRCTHCDEYICYLCYADLHSGGVCTVAHKRADAIVDAVAKGQEITPRFLG